MTTQQSLCFRHVRSLVTFRTGAIALLSLLLLAPGCSDGDPKPKPDAQVQPDAAQQPDSALQPDAQTSDAVVNPPDGTIGPDASAPQDPGETGGETPTTWTEQVAVGSGGEATTLTVTLHGPSSAGPHPVLIFTHGFQLAPSDYASYGQHLASWGYVVIMPAMPGSAFSPTPHRVLKIYLRDLITWVETNGTTVGGPLQGKADVSRLALAGHSMGGKISFLAATEDARPKGVFGVDPVDAAGGLGGPSADYPSVTPELMPQITVPIVSLGETLNSTGGMMGQACAPAADNFQQYYQYATSPALEVDVKNANHMSFLDDPNCGFVCSACPAGTDDTAVTRRLTRRTLTAFLEVFLRQRPEHRYWLTGAGMTADVTAGLLSIQQKNNF
ncbi:MAG: hypothetical protein RBU30_24070 [Polyangia bacterium]|jgi:dienelactone hydrolase|nr:hypothetical protein [Polyangia bacterium]